MASLTPHVTQSDPNDDALFPDIDADSPVTEIESLCMACHEQGMTRLLLTNIPFFRNVVLMSFACPHCGERNNEIQSAEGIEELGVRYELTCRSIADLNRQMIKASTATVSFPELELEIPPVTQRGSLNTIQGFLCHTADSLEASLDTHRALGIADEELVKLVSFIARLRSVSEGEQLPLTVVLDDPAGNSFCQNPHAPAEDPDLKQSHYRRNSEQQRLLGLPENEQPDEVLSLPGRCPDCNFPGSVKMVVTDVPHFKEVIIMAFTCDKCGYKSNEVKSGGAVPPMGKRITLRVEDAEDLNRSVIKSETASVEIPEIELELSEGTLGGKFTSVEGLLDDIVRALAHSPFVVGDSADADHKTRYATFIARLRELRQGNTKFTLIITDPVANSYVQNPYAPDEDPQLTVVEYKRSAEEEDDLGITDMVTTTEQLSAANARSHAAAAAAAAAAADADAAADR